MKTPNSADSVIALGGDPMRLDGEEGGDVTLAGTEQLGPAHQRADRAVTTLLLGRLALAVGGDHSGRRHDDQDGDGGQRPAEPAALAGMGSLLIGLALPRRRGLGDRRIQECLLQFGQVGERRRLPLQRGFQSGAAVQLRARPTERFPALGRRGEVAEDPLPGGILVEP